MSLPPLLLARLKKRGIIKEKEEVEEEVFAENYDKEDDDQVDVSEKHRGGAPGCPNKYNHYHLCTEFCFDHWREGYPEHRLSDKYLQQRKKILKQFPLPSGWKEVYDAGMRRHYYWCQNTDEVSWLPPKHPKAVISEAAPKLAKEFLGSVKVVAREYSKKPYFSEKETGRERERDEGSRSRKVERYRGKASQKRRRDGSGSGGEEGRRSPTPEIELSERDRLKRAKRKGIDPMDPAAYGDAPAGSWSSGLTADVKTGADVTANGPLFQQRPYPAPGAILRRNNPDFDKDSGK